MSKVNTRAYVLLSGGIDSSTCLAVAVRDYGVSNVEGISIDYGQRHHKEIDAARSVCKWLDVVHSVHGITGMPQVMLTDPEAEVPNISYQEIEGVSPTYVPFRNGQLISRIAGIAAHDVEQRNKLKVQTYTKQYGFKGGIDDLPLNAKTVGCIYFGAHAEDAAGDAYPDCRLDFVGAMAAAVYIGTYHMVRLKAPLIEMYKNEVVRLGRDLSVPFHLTWSCYKGEALHCGTCPTCRARKAAFLSAEVTDPTYYAVP